MRCEVLNCKENEDGYCTCASYVTITADGMCDQMYIPTDKEQPPEN